MDEVGMKILKAMAEMKTPAGCGEMESTLYLRLDWS